MRESVYKNYNEARILEVSPSSDQPDFTVLHVDSRMVMPKDKFMQWAEEHTGGAI